MKIMQLLHACLACDFYPHVIKIVFLNGSDNLEHPMFAKGNAPHIYVSNIDL